MKIYMLNILKFIVFTALLVYLGQVINQAEQGQPVARDEDDFFTLSTPAAIHFLNKDPKRDMDCIQNIKQMTGRTVIEIPAKIVTGNAGSLPTRGDRATAL